MAPKWEFWTLYTYWDAFLVVLGDSLLFKSISNMNIGFIVQKHPLNTFFGPLEASRGLKIGPNWEFWYLYTYWDAFLDGSGWHFASQVYIHHGHWVHSLEGPLKHLFWASRGLKGAQNWPKLRALNPIHLLGCFFGFSLGYLKWNKYSIKMTWDTKFYL